MIHFIEDYRGKGFGKKAMQHWEDEMRLHGHKMIMLSTQIDETSQHFYRKLGCKDIGCLVLNFPACEQPLEMFMAKEL